MGLFARLFGSPEAPAVTSDASGQRHGRLVETEEEFGNPDLLAAIDRLENPRPDHRMEAAERKVLRAFDDEESRRRMVACIRRLLHEGNPARGGSES